MLDLHSTRKSHYNPKGVPRGGPRGVKTRHVEVKPAPQLQKIIIEGFEIVFWPFGKGIIFEAIFEGGF